MLITNRILCVFFSVILLTVALTSCGASAEKSNEPMRFDSFRDVSGITKDEIRAIEAFSEEGHTFVFAMLKGADAFYGEDGRFHGFAALFTEWLTGFFGLPFELRQYEWHDILAGLESGEIDFTAELTLTEERRKVYCMTDPILQRTVRTCRLRESLPFGEIAEARPVRLGFMEGTTNITYVTSTFKYPFEIIEIGSQSQAYDVLKNGTADAYFDESGIEYFFEGKTDMVFNDYFPLIYVPISMTTQKQENEPVIAIMQKMMQNGGTRQIVQIFTRGWEDFRKHSLFQRLTVEEKAYIANHPVVPFGADYNYYPIEFYDVNKHQLEGIALDVLHEISNLTGLRFDAVNDSNTSWSELLHMLETDRVSLITNLLYSEDRVGRFQWPETPYLEEIPALISTIDFPDITANELLFLRVGLQRYSAHESLFRKWFPNHQNIVEIDHLEDAIRALEKGEIDLVMTSLQQLQYLTNYREMPGFKANYVFDSSIKSTFGVNIDETILCSILDKSLQMVDTQWISDRWTRKTYDYRTKLVEAQRPWFFGVATLAAGILVLICLLFLRNRRQGALLESEVRNRTAQLQKTQKDLEVAVKAAESASRTKSAFLASVSHEIRTPMNVILGVTEIELDDEGLPIKYRDSFEKIQTSGELLLHIINDILDLSKIEAGKFELIPGEYDLPSLIYDVANQNMTHFECKRLEFEVKVDENLPVLLFGDELRMKQILNNILSNACKYTSAGTVKLSILAKQMFDNDGGCVLSFSISDTGQGMSEEQVSKLFEEYTRFNREANRTTTGTGLGMSITKGLLALMNGEIAVESTLEKGSTFTVTIPQEVRSDKRIGRALADNLQEFKLSDHAPLKKAKLKRELMPYGKVLLVDDMTTNLDVATLLLRPYGLQIDKALSGYETIDKVEGGMVYDVIFMDHMMPKMDGVETTKKLRASGYTQPIVALTANAVVGQADMFLENGFDGFISKPIDIRQLDELLNRLVRDKHK
jgi:signal transduction histidine kinase/ActR/RegA family two-component response regulator